MILGVTGKIASGKSEVLKILEKRGFYCIDADDIVHELYKSGGRGAKEVSKLFGKEHLSEDGEVDRLRLRDLVFGDVDRLKLLNEAIHPLVYEEISKILSECNYKNIAIEAAYFDSGYLLDLVEKILWVERPGREIIRTLIEDRNFPYELAEKAYSLIEKPLEIDFEIVNDGDLKELSEKVWV